jgi:cytochrome c peroxidase
VVVNLRKKVIHNRAVFLPRFGSFPIGRKFKDSGRIVVTGNPEDIGKFKVGSLRNVAVTAPHMHNGMMKTLEEGDRFL